jgi:hypothetical protein
MTAGFLAIGSLEVTGVLEMITVEEE